ncbi:DUF3052 domain-containing protein [Mycetocola miduiensis]|uniref:DUF3052 domain-containing protein n=1 Tax=Mycetocola miduiensis TaxID=995034 RepID=A0A1I5D052_9MICO|nr:DUF3052 domain-containing protein [Mycetocola miduiensis]SFN92630.1 Protein of unknown function [Mycetocola miduiensis]
MAGYSSSSQARKLGLKPGLRLLLDSAPEGWHLDEAPDGVDVVTDAASADIVLSFVTEAAGIRSRIEALGQRIHPDGALWIAWPRKAAGHVSEVTENLIRVAALELGLVDVKVAAVTEDWSGLKLVWRVENRDRLNGSA